MDQVIYILSDNRSGSTLLDQLLGAHGEIVSLGEVHHLSAYALEDRSLYNPSHPLICSCGEKLDRCQFWQRVERRLGRKLGSLKLSLRFFEWMEPSAGGAQAGQFLPRRLVTRHPAAFRNSFVRRLFDSHRAAADSFALFDAIFAETHARYLVDSSKLPFRFRSLYEFQADRLKAVLLSRDYRGAVRSKMKRGSGLDSGAKSWALRMRAIKAMTRDVPQRQLIRVKYEDLCRDPRGELSRLCDFLEVDFSESMLERPASGTHHLGGSPSKFDSTRRAIELDLSYLGAFSERELARMSEIVGDAAAEWGYN